MSPVRNQPLPSASDPARTVFSWRFPASWGLGAGRVAISAGLWLGLAAPAAAGESSFGEPQKREWIRQYGKPGPASPEITRVYQVAPDILALTIEAQKVVPSRLEAYRPQPGDEKHIEKWPDGAVRRAILVRDGKEIGWLQGRELDQFSNFEGIEGDPFLFFLAEDPANFTITSPKSAAPVHPEKVFRKSVPIDWQLPENHLPMRHTLYLKLSVPLNPGQSYRIEAKNVNVKNPRLDFVAGADRWTEAIHVNQIGYRPDDPAKKAFLSVWMGSGGPLIYPPGLRFSIIDEATGKSVFEGTVEQRLAANAVEPLGPGTPENNSKTAVSTMSFDSLTQPGRYHVEIAGVGSSYPFEIRDDVWQKAFQVQMHGLYNNRSGAALGPPYTSFRKPPDFFPADGAVVTRSTYDPMTQGNEDFAGIAQGDTGESVPEAWGGYHDAGDWNPRRASHLAVTMAQLELLELFPGYFRSLKLRLPSRPGLPDLLTEALYHIDFFRRLQRSDGAVPFGVETQGDPSPGEVSWLSTMHAYVLAPNIRDTWQYAAAAARAARILEPYDAKLAAVYRESAVRAFDWAEAEYARLKAGHRLESLQDVWHATDNRNLAALILYDLTGDRRYHDIFREDTCLKDPAAGTYYWGKYMQSEAAFYYARLPEGKGDSDLKKNARAAVLRAADASLRYAEGNVFNLTTADKYRPLFGGFFSTAGGIELVRAHYLTGDRSYLAGAVRSCQFLSGCNPNNLVYTSGLGANPVRHPLHLDSRSSGQPPPDGLTTFGNVDYWHQKGEFFTWPLAFISKPQACYPNPYEWPLLEAYFDVGLYVSMNEFVVDAWTPNVLVWGYLAARPKS